MCVLKQKGNKESKRKRKEKLKIKQRPNKERRKKKRDKKTGEFVSFSYGKSTIEKRQQKTFQVFSRSIRKSCIDKCTVIHDSELLIIIYNIFMIN